MPKDTFFNLPEDKRERILDAAIDEFAKYSYHKASINRIVDRADIAKGSFYQYFEDKKDLYKFIVEKISEKKMDYLNDAMKNIAYDDFFQIVRELYIAGIRFAKDNPGLSAIGDNFMKENDSRLREEILGDNISKSDYFFEQLLYKGIEKGNIDPNIDVKLVAHLITSMSISISEYFFKEVKVQDDMEIMILIDKMLYILKNGIKNRGEIKNVNG